MTAPPPLPTTATSTTSVFVTVAVWLAWLAVIVLADFMALMMFAFADSPGMAKTAGRMIGPAFAWVAVTFVAGVVLLIWGGWPRVAIAFVLAASPPFLVFAGYNVLGVDGASTTTPIPPAVPMTVPPGGFVPTSLPTTQPTFDARPDRT